MSKASKILAAIQSHSRRGKFSGKWARTECDACDFFRTREDLLSELRRNFMDADLLEARALVRSADNSVELNPILRSKTGLVMAIRLELSEDPLALLTNSGSTSRLPPGVLPLLHYRLQEFLDDSEQRIYVVGTVEEMAILLSCGLPATIAGGLDRLPGKQIEHLRHRLRKAVSPMADEDSSLTATLVLADWSITGLHGADQPWVPGLGEFLSKLTDCLQAKFYGGIWKPDDQALERMQFCLSAGLHDALGQHLLRSSGGTGWERYKKSPPSDYAEAVQQLLHCAIDDLHKANYKSHHKAFVQSLEAELIRPLLSRAADTPDPVTRILLTTLADLARQFHLESMSQTSKSCSQSVPPRSPARAESSRDPGKATFMLADRVLSISKELQRCKERQPRKK